MGDRLGLIGYHYSVYTRIVRMAGIAFELQLRYTEADPFAAHPDPVLAAHTPLGRVPVLTHGDFILTETAAILRYLSALAAGPSLVPNDPKAAARMAQVIGIVDAYGYVPMVRQVFSNAVFAPMMNEAGDPEQIVRGLAGAKPALSLLNEIATEGLVLNGTVTLADIHLAPMISYFTMAKDGAALLAQYAALAMWWARASTLPCLQNTDPFAPQAHLPV
ncbi:glutathione S-transferase family protein [Sulfitobacter sp. SK012]|uniref:glutathione S-transferase family protein n=1 Tax=Sulfitobacter sp. SK012 TaxID=1389005 RepID=UPI000E0C9664|nr:glutathione S-transferase family protein [Sulfitobacter sp. SK012]AXI48318.1 glutathione S-transferase family protein [Sulfitobacter sp. SK012]